MHNELGTCVEDYHRLVKQGKIKIGILIRIYNYGTGVDKEKYFVVGEKGLYHAHSEDDTPLKPEDVLSKEAAPDNWSVEGMGICSLPESELIPYLKKLDIN